MKLTIYVTQDITGWWTAWTNTGVLTEKTTIVSYENQRRDLAIKGILRLLGVSRKDVSFSTLLPHSEQTREE